MPTMLPPLYAQLVLSDGEGRDWQSRVEAIDPYALTVARPFDLPLDGGPTPGSALELSWGSDGGSFSQPVELVETVRDGNVALWVLTPKGEATRSQRRAHFRLDLDGEVALSVQDEAFDGHLVDVSEAGLRVRLTPDDARAFRPGAPVAAAFEIRQDRFELNGRVLRSWPSARANGDDATDVVLVLELGEPQARDLRRAMMAEQVQRRRLERD